MCLGIYEVLSDFTVWRLYVFPYLQGVLKRLEKGCITLSSVCRDFFAGFAQFLGPKASGGRVRVSTTLGLLGLHRSLCLGLGFRA